MSVLHLRIALFTLLGLLLWTALRFVSEQRATEIHAQPIAIAIEHAGNAAVTLTRSTKHMPQFVDFSNDGAQAIRISLPAAWERGEVRNAALSEIVTEEPSPGYRRWQLPAGATLSFLNPLPATAWTVHNPSGLPLRLRTVMVDIDSGRVMREVYLLSEEPLRLSDEQLVVSD
jgi:hypothetical protein